MAASYTSIPSLATSSRRPSVGIHKESSRGSHSPDHARHRRAQRPARRASPARAMPPVPRSTAPASRGQPKPSAAATGAASAAASRSRPPLRQRRPAGSAHRTAAGSVTLRPSPTATQPFVAPPASLAQDAAHLRDHRTMMSLGHLSRTGGTRRDRRAARRPRDRPGYSAAAPTSALARATARSARGRPGPIPSCGPGCPAPPRWVSATTAVPAGAPASASRCSSSCVDDRVPSRYQLRASRRARAQEQDAVRPTASRYHANGDEAAAWRRSG